MAKTPDEICQSLADKAGGFASRLTAAMDELSLTMLEMYAKVDLEKGIVTKEEAEAWMNRTKGEFEERKKAAYDKAFKKVFDECLVGMKETMSEAESRCKSYA